MTDNQTSNLLSIFSVDENGNNIAEIKECDLMPDDIISVDVESLTIEKECWDILFKLADDILYHKLKDQLLNISIQKHGNQYSLIFNCKETDKPFMLNITEELILNLNVGQNEFSNIVSNSVKRHLDKIKEKPECDHVVGYYHNNGYEISFSHLSEFDLEELIKRNIKEGFHYFNYCPICGVKLEGGE